MSIILHDNYSGRWRDDTENLQTFTQHYLRFLHVMSIFEDCDAARERILPNSR